jgi:hypothetical protein
MIITKKMGGQDCTYQLWHAGFETENGFLVEKTLKNENEAIEYINDPKNKERFDFIESVLKLNIYVHDGYLFSFNQIFNLDCIEHAHTITETIDGKTKYGIQFSFKSKYQVKNFLEDERTLYCVFDLIKISISKTWGSSIVEKINKWWSKCHQ